MRYSKKKLNDVLSLDDFELAARRYLPNVLFAYVSGGVETDTALTQNRTVFEELGFVPRVMRDVSSVDISATLWDDKYAAPFGIAPMGLSALTAFQGDLVQARAAGHSNLPMIMSGSSLTRLEDVAAVGNHVWFQAYLPGDIEQIEALIARVEKAGYEKLVITVDFPVAANRENNLRAGFSTPLRPSLRLLLDGLMHPHWLTGTFFRTLIKSGIPHFENNYATRGVPIVSRNLARDFAERGHLNWSHFKRVRELWPGKLIIKGVLAADDARTAADLGADGVIVSNHGGRQLDYVVSPLRVLPEIVRACPDIPVMMDSGIRRGSDALKAFALGAKFVFVGRPFNYAAAIGGEQGVLRAIELLSSELRRNVAMLGLTKISQTDATCIRTLAPPSLPFVER